MTVMRNLRRQSAQGRPIYGVPDVGILASQIISDTATGEHGPGILYDDALANPGKLLRAKVTNWTGTPGTLTVLENGAILIEGEPSGVYTIAYTREAWASDGSVSVISDTSSVQIGPINASAEGGVGTSTGTGSGGTATGVVSATGATALGGTGTSTGAGFGGTATGEVVSLDATAEGGVGTSVGSGTGGLATTSPLGSISDADIARIVASLMAALHSTTIPVDVHKVLTAPVPDRWATASETGDAVWNKVLS